MLMRLPLRMGCRPSALAERLPSVLAAALSSEGRGRRAEALDAESKRMFGLSYEEVSKMFVDSMRFDAASRSFVFGGGLTREADAAMRLFDYGSGGTKGFAPFLKALRAAYSLEPALSMGVQMPWR